MTRDEVRKLEFIVQIIQNILCRHCKHHDGFSTYDYEVCNDCCHYVNDKFEFKGE